MNSIQVPMPNNSGQEAQVLPLRDIKLPTEPGFWPLAPGWWMLIIVVSALAFWLGIKWYRYRLKKRRWLEIEQQLSELEFIYQQNKDQQQLLTGISAFLRRFVKYQLNQGRATALVGNDWVAHLNLYDQSQPFNEYKSALTAGVYQADCDYDAQGLLQLTRNFIHKQVMKPNHSIQLISNQADEEQQQHV